MGRSSGCGVDMCCDGCELSVGESDPEGGYGLEARVWRGMGQVGREDEVSADTWYLLILSTSTYIARVCYNPHQ